MGTEEENQQRKISRGDSFKLQLSLVKLVYIKSMVNSQCDLIHWIIYEGESAWH